MRFSSIVTPGSGSESEPVAMMMCLAAMLRVPPEGVEGAELGLGVGLDGAGGLVDHRPVLGGEPRRRIAARAEIRPEEEIERGV